MTSAEINRDARSRAVRTFVQGLAFDVVVAVVLFALPVVTGLNGLDGIEWGVICFSLVKTIILAGLSYTARVLGLGQATLPE